MNDPAASQGRGHTRMPSSSPSRASPLHANCVDDGASGDIALSMPASSRPLAAGRPRPRDRDVSAPTSSKHAGISATNSTPSSRQLESDMGDLLHSRKATRSSPSTHARRQQNATISYTPEEPSSPRLGSPSGSMTARRAITRSRSLNVRIPSVDLTQRDDTASATTSTAPYPAFTPPSAEIAPSPRPPPLIDDTTAASMSRWVKEIVVCNFDLERGPVVERRAGGRRWGQGVKENVAFSSFPDTSLFTEGSIQFSFKIRHLPPSPTSLAFPEPPSPGPGGEAPRAGQLGPGLSPRASRDKAAEYRAWDERGREWLYGFVWFQQQRDRGIARGYMQLKSVVILSHLPFPALFSAVLAKLAPAYFQYGYSALEVACHSIAQWPDPAPDITLELPLMSDVLSVRLPDTTENPQLGRTKDPILASLPPSTPLRAFSTFLPSLWSIWECLVLAEPVLVIAPDPRTCSEIVWWLRELVRPIPLAGDFRPYLHIHDRDFSLLVNANKPQVGVVVGVTNPFFRNAASHWPNVISIPGATKQKQPPNAPAQQHGFISRRKRSIAKDRVLLARLESLVAAGRLDDVDGNAALRTYFQQLTERFLVPLNRYFQTLVPPRSATPSGASTPIRSMSSTLLSSSPSRGLLAVPNAPPALSLSAIKPFSLPTFLSHLKTHGPNPLSFKSRALSTKTRVESDFYAGFCMSATFAGWLAARVESLGIAVAANTLLPRRSHSPSSDVPSDSTGASGRTSGGGRNGPVDWESARSSLSTSSGTGEETPKAEPRRELLDSPTPKGRLEEGVAALGLR